MNTKYFDCFLICAIIFLPFQDFILSKSAIGFLGLSPSFIFILLYVVIKLFAIPLRFACLNKNKVYIVFYVVVFNAVSLFINFGGVEYGRDVAVKGLNLFVLYLLLFFPFFERKRNLPNVYKMAFLLSLIICILGIIFGDYLNSVIVNNDILHANVRVSERPRGFSYETSMLSVTLFGLFFCYVCIGNTKKNFSILNLFCFVIIAILTTSKGALFSVFFSMLCTYFLNKNTFSYKGWLYLIFGVVVFYVMAPFFMNMILLDIDNGTSVITRIIAVLTSCFSLYNNPLGVGYFGYLSAFKMNSLYAVDFFERIFQIKADFFEVNEFIYGATDTVIGAKSLLFNGLIIYGVPFLFFYFWCIYLIIHKCRLVGRKDLEISAWFMFITLSTYVEGLGLYVIGFYFLVVNSEIFRMKSLRNILISHDIE